MWFVRWVLVILMFNGMGQFKIGTSEMIYFDKIACEHQRSIQDQALEKTKPSEHAYFLTACFEMPEVKKVGTLL